MENSIVVFILGIVVGAVLTAKPDALRNMTPLAFGYTLFGLALAGATLLLEWAGFACVMSAFVLYHAVGRAGSNAIQTFFSLKWLPSFKRKKKNTTVPPDPNRGHTPNTPRTASRSVPTEEIVDDPVAKLDAERDQALQTEDGKTLPITSPGGEVMGQMILCDQIQRRLDNY